MIHIDLTSEETGLLISTLEDVISDLRMEIVDTEQMDFRNALKIKKGVMIKVLEALQRL